jgi:hypothetical protein
MVERKNAQFTLIGKMNPEVWCPLKYIVNRRLSELWKYLPWDLAG